MTTFTKRIGADTDDGFKSNFGGGSYYTNFINLGYYASDDARIGVFRFNNVTIPGTATINSAKLTLYRASSLTGTYNHIIRGVDEDDTASFSSDPTGRPTTSASANWSFTNWTAGTTKDTSDFASVIQEIIDRAGWASGNDLGIFIYSAITGDTGSYEVRDYSESTTLCALLTIEYTDIVSPSASLSPSSSLSPSPSRSLSPSSSVSVSMSPSPSSSPSPSPGPTPNQAVLKIAKPGVNAMTNSDPEKFIFNSEYGTLKYFDKEPINLTIDANGGEIGCKGEYTHNLGYYPFCEVFVSVYIGSPTGVYEYCPFAGAGATVLYDATVKIDTSKITVYGQIDGMSTSLWHFDFLVFVYKNDLAL